MLLGYLSRCESPVRGHFWPFPLLLVHEKLGRQCPHLPFKCVPTLAPSEHTPSKPYLYVVHFVVRIGISCCIRFAILIANLIIFLVVSCFTFYSSRFSCKIQWLSFLSASTIPIEEIEKIANKYEILNFMEK